MPMPLRYVKEIHSRLSVRYGSAWQSKWANVPQELLEADWSMQLDGMQPDSIRKALDNLPADFPPTAAAFRNLGVIRGETMQFVALEGPAVDPVVAKVALGAMNTTGMPTPREWMAQLEADVLSDTATAGRKRHYAIAKANGYYGGATE